MTISGYIHAAMASARYKLLYKKTVFGEIPGFRGVWANEHTLEGCRETLQEVLEEWIVLKLRDRDPLPRVRGRTLTIPAPSRA